MIAYSSDEAILADLGTRLGAARLARNATQAELAREAGVSKRTLERLEAGQPTQFTSFIRVLRALDQLDGLDLLLPAAEPGPMDLLRSAGKVPQRASKGGRPPSKPWSWGDE
jgi:transcriptional regulator with XRE-family HTH domain